MSSLMTDYTPPATKPRTKKAMTAYLEGHPRYDTGNSWNAATSYARKIKLGYVKFPDKETQNAAYEITCSDTDWWQDSGLKQLVREFDERWNHSWQLGTNGRSGGYLVLYQGGTEPSGYQSYCEACGQQNYAHVECPDESPEGRVRKIFFSNPTLTDMAYRTKAEFQAIDVSDVFKIECLGQARLDYSRWNKNVTTDNVCGVCHAHARVNYDKPPVRVITWAYRGVDMARDYADWDKDTLAERVEVVWDLDQTVGRMAKTFIDYCRDHRVVEEEVMVPRTVRRVRKRKAAK